MSIRKLMMKNLVALTLVEIVEYRVQVRGSKMKYSKLRFLGLTLLFVISLVINNLLALPSVGKTDLKEGTVIFLLDNSGSMDQPYKGDLKINTAKDSIRNTLTHHKSDFLKLGLFELGGHCEVTERVSPELNNQQIIINALDQVRPRPYRDASTPIAKGVYMAVKTLKNEPGYHKIILVSDGEANCFEDGEFPLSGCNMIASLKRQNIDFDLSLIGYGRDALVNEEAKCIAGLSDQVYDTRTSEELDIALKKEMPNGIDFSSSDPFSHINDVLKSFEKFCMSLQGAFTALIALLIIFRKPNPPNPPNPPSPPNLEKFW